MEEAHAVGLMTAATCLLIQRRRKLRRRSCYVRGIFQHRHEFGEYHQLVNEMKLFDSEVFTRYLRMKPSVYEDLLKMVGPRLQHRPNHMRPIGPSERLTLTIRFLASGDSQQSISFSYRISKAAVGAIIMETCIVLWEVLQPLYLVPPDTNKWENIATLYGDMWNFPNCVGAIDGKHVTIQAPANSGSAYFNYKCAHSIVLMAVCDAKYCFTLVDIGSPGRNSDGGIFSNSVFGQMMMTGNLQLPDNSSIRGINTRMPFVFVADEAFPLKTNIMRPFPGSNLSEQKRVFNYRLSRARRTIENVFGILATRWRVFRHSIIAKPEKAIAIVKACVCLHNYLMTNDNHQHNDDRTYCPHTSVDTEEEFGVITPGQWRDDLNGEHCLRNIGQVGSSRFGLSAAAVRNTFMEYFSSDAGKVAWQWAHIRRGSQPEL